ncbi:L-lactate dehydrogenase [Propionibacteriaceae bacterium G57]|uniref:L-lactate dehydrogenase n=1 Tax=Aestuariimicrobium sp. G57 TaxID=3418485 RepID=UPI003DA71611
MRNTSKKLTKLSVIGAGAVGTAVAYASIIRGSAQQVALYDINEAKVVAEVKDLQHGTQFTPVTEVMGGSDPGVVAGSDVVVVTAGAKQNPGQTRLDLAAKNVKILGQMLPQLLEHAPDAVYVLVTNPVDVLTYEATRIAGLPAGRVFGSGTLLDTSRLRLMLAQKAQVAQGNVHAVMMGEHGDTEFPVWSSATIGSVPLREWERDGKPVFTDAVLDELAHSVTNAAYEVIEGKGATNYAIGLAGARIVEAIINDEQVILPVSTVLDDYRSITDVALSVPSLIGRQGVTKVYEIPMSVAERKQLRASADTLRAALDELTASAPAQEG